MEYLRNNIEEGDSIYLNNSATDAFIYYQNRLKFPKKTVRIGRILDDVFQNEKAFAEIRYEKHVYDEKGMFLGIIKDSDIGKYYRISKDQPYRTNGSKRVWVIFSHAKSELKELVLEVLDNQGKRLKEYEKEGASIFLYDLSTNEDIMPK